MEMELFLEERLLVNWREHKSVNSAVFWIWSVFATCVKLAIEWWAASLPDCMASKWCEIIFLASLVAYKCTLHNLNICVCMCSTEIDRYKNSLCHTLCGFAVFLYLYVQPTKSQSGINSWLMPVTRGEVINVSVWAQLETASEWF